MLYTNPLTHSIKLITLSNQIKDSNHEMLMFVTMNVQREATGMNLMHGLVLELSDKSLKNVRVRRAVTKSFVRTVDHTMIIKNTNTSTDMVA
jgi:hypothetical protein